MRLQSLHLVNFRQHADTLIEFGSGLTGIIGPNGSGKSTILEAIAWVLYGNSAARGTKDTIRRLGAEESRVPVRVALRFELAGHRYHVIRSLSNAECFLDDSKDAVATTVKGVSEFMQQRLGMTRAEFFHTYFTGQKELDVMSALGPVERARFLSRVLGYDKVSSAQELIRERRREVAAELSGLRQGMGDAETIGLSAKRAQDQLAEYTQALKHGMKEAEAAVVLAQVIEPEWQELQRTRERYLTLDAERRIVEAELVSNRTNEERIGADLKALEETAKELTSVRSEIDSIGDVRHQLEVMERLASVSLRRKDWLDRERRDKEELQRLTERAAQLAQATTMEPESRAKVISLRDELEQTDRSIEEHRTNWVRDKQEVDTKLEALRQNYVDLSEQHSVLKGLGAESPCPTCGRPLGENYSQVLEQVHQQLETVRVDGQYYRQRSEQLAVMPPSLSSLIGTKQQLQIDLQQSERKLQRIEAALLEAASLVSQRTTLEERIANASHELALLPEGYDSAQHSALKERSARLEALELKAVRTQAQLERRDMLIDNLEQVRNTIANLNKRMELLLGEVEQVQEVVGSAAFAATKERYESAFEKVHQAELAVSSASARVEEAKSQVVLAQQALEDFQQRQIVAAKLDAEHRLHDELDRAFAEIRSDLNSELRPELAETASALLSELTDGRYKHLEFDDNYRLMVLEDEVRKPVLSGGEEDLCNLVLRLAISQMIAERAGQAFSLLILDEVFGSLDENRRSSVVDLLRHLHDRFEQVIVITHIEQVREGLDQVIQVEFDETRRASVVRAMQ